MKSLKGKRWKFLRKKKKKNLSTEKIIEILLKNRDITTKKKKEEFLNPKDPKDLSVKDVGIKKSSVKKAVKRVKKAVRQKEKIIIYGDYDADGVCATAIIWETLFGLDADVSPYIPERFSEGYGLNIDSIKALKEKNPELSLIITVDNGITAVDAVNEAKELGIDVIVTDHHQKGKKLPKAHSIIHTTQIGGAGISWIFSNELYKEFDSKKTPSLELVAIGTIADQIPLLQANRSFVKYGLDKLNKTKRPGLLALFKEAGVKKGQIGTYTIGFIIAPRLNAMGRLEHAIDSLRLLCTTSQKRADNLAKKVGKTNSERQKIVENVVVHARKRARSNGTDGLIFVSHESYHEGVIGLAASRLVEEFYRPSIVLSKGRKVSKASARSIPGFNIIEAIRNMDDMLLSGGGHPMAAGFSINTKDLDKFSKKLSEITSDLLSDDILERVLKIDLEIDFSHINWNLMRSLKKFEPTGIGNPTPSFATTKVSVLSSRTVGKNGGHLKLRLVKDNEVFDAIGFGMGELAQKIDDEPIDISYNLEENVWRGKSSLQLKLKDIKTR